MNLLPIAAALAVAATSPLPAQSEEAPAENTKVVCRRMQATGTLVRKRKLCMTQVKWEEYFAANREIVDGMREGICASRDPLGCSYFDDMKQNQWVPK